MTRITLITPIRDAHRFHAGMTRIRALESGLRALGHEVSLVAAWEDARGGERFGTGWRRAWQIVKDARRTARRARGGDWLIIDSPPPLLAWLVLRRRHPPTNVIIADLWPESLIENGFLKRGLRTWIIGRITRRVLARAERVTAVTEGLYDRLSGRVDADRLDLLVNGAGNLASSPATGREVLCPGNFSLAHDFDTALACAEQMPDTTFTFIGQGTQEQHLRETIAQRRLGNVQVVGPMPADQLAARLQEGGVGLITLPETRTIQDTRPARLIGMMAAGLPVVYAGGGEGAKLLQEAGAGIVVPSGDAGAAVAALQAALGDRAMGQAGLDFVEANLQWDNLINDWSRFLTPP